mmetsp:Transcript_37118/g.95845  ORF Transcript_37118/g.95845 Transcript_37118/m.95845 type:complete len:301 (+) Transcript_37118:206-1108(+)
MLAQAARRSHPLRPGLDDAHVLLLQMPHRDHRHVQVRREPLLHHLGDHLPLSVLPAAAQVVAVREADKPARRIGRHRNARLVQQLQARGHGVEEARATGGLRLQRRQARVDELLPCAPLYGPHHRRHLRPKADDADQVVVFHLVPQDPLHARRARLESVLRRPRVPGHHRSAPVEAEYHDLRTTHRGRQVGHRRPAADGAARLRCAHHRRFGRPPHVPGLRPDGVRVEARQHPEGICYLPHAHPPVALADIHEALSRLWVLDGLALLAHDLLAELVHTHAAVVERRRAADALGDLALAPA